MKELIIALLTAFLSGITFLAYKHPHAYKKLSLSSLIFNTGETLLFVGVAWSFGINSAHSALVQFIPIDKQASALKAIESIKLPALYAVIVLTAWLCLWFYSIFLRFLPHLLKKET